MKKVCFVVSHLGSGSLDLVDILNRNPRCQIQCSSAQYESPESLNWLLSTPHKCRDSSAIYGDHLLYNMSISCKNLYEFCKFIYVIRPARASLNEIATLQDTGLSEQAASDYYRFRLRRMCEMARRTRDAVLVTWDDLAKGKAFPTIEEYLGLNKQLVIEHHHFSLEGRDSFKEALIEQSQDAYERYYYYLNNLGLRRAFA
jgi:hypothetical protein